MMQVQLIVTGELERIALHKSLANLFRDDVVFLQPQKVDDMTSRRLPEIPSPHEIIRTNAGKMAAALVAAVHPGRDKSAPKVDLAIAIDDLELANADQPQHVISYFRAAVEAHVREHFPTDTTQARVLDDIRRRASFHMLVPMLETYFFGEEDALVRAEATQSPCRFDPTACDLECFIVDDPDYLGNPPIGAAWNKPGRERHPKNYVRFLCAQPGQATPKYRETHQGAAALSKLAWTDVVADAERVRFARSLLRDIEDVLGVKETPFPGETHPLTVVRDGGLLRNI